MVGGVVSEVSDGLHVLIVEEVAVDAVEEVLLVGHIVEVLSDHESLLRVHDDELPVWLESGVVGLLSVHLLPPWRVSRGWSWSVLVQDGPDEGVETLVGDSSVVDGESDEGGQIVVVWSASDSSFPQVSDASWDSGFSVSSSFDGLLHPVSEESVVNWISLDDASDDLSEPLVSGVGWSSGDDSDEVVNHVWEGWSSSVESSSSPSDSGSLGFLSVESHHVAPGESVSQSGWSAWSE